MRRLVDHPLLISSLLAAIAYAPALNNGFIADDYVILQRIDLMRFQPLYLFHVPPENFRLISHMIFVHLKRIAGYLASLFYFFTSISSNPNIAMLRYLLILVTNEE